MHVAERQEEEPVVSDLEPPGQDEGEGKGAGGERDAGDERRERAGRRPGDVGDPCGRGAPGRVDACPHLGPARGAVVFTLGAATAGLGSDGRLMLGAHTPAPAPGFFAVGLWVVLLNAWFAAAVMVDPKPTLDRGIDGSWFLLTVSTQSIAVLGTYIANQFSAPEQVIFVCLAFYMLGAMFYLWVIGLVLLRWLFYPMERKEALSPNYWINSGAMAITTLAGARLIATTSAHVASLAHFLTAFNLLFWATASWWIPLLFIVNAWRLLVERFPLRYEPGYWSMVFPLGMYVACTWAYAQSADMPFLKPIARGGIFVAWAAWAVAWAAWRLRR